jgi:hypothetical protein
MAVCFPPGFITGFEKVVDIGTPILFYSPSSLPIVPDGLAYTQLDDLLSIEV